MTPLVVGFDLDQTLYDTEPAIAATLHAVVAELGVDFDVGMAMEELGPPLGELVGLQLPQHRVAAFVRKYREIYHLYGLPAARLMPGAREALDAVDAAGGACVVISGKNTRDVTRHITRDRLPVRNAIGGSWGPVKTVVMKEYGVSVYIGDHPADVAAARDAGAVALAITTGSHGAASFADADEIFSNLEEFCGWFDRHMRRVNAQPWPHDGIAALIVRGRGDTA